METYDLFKKSLRGHLSLPSHLSIQLILLSSYPLPRVTRKDLSTKVVKHSISAYHHENSHGDKKIQTYYKLKQQNASKCVKVVPICLATAICCTNTFPNYPFLKCLISTSKSFKSWIDTSLPVGSAHQTSAP